MAQAPPQAVVQDLTHTSQVMGGPRSYRVILPPAYTASTKRYPVIYWFHGYEQSNARRDAGIAGYVGSHDVIVVDVGPVESGGRFPLYFPELTGYIDKTLRTVADREHRAAAGYATAGFFAWWLAGKYPDLVSSASNVLGFTEDTVGPEGFDVECNLDELFGNFDGVRTLLVTGAPDALRFYHRRLNGIWLYARGAHESEDGSGDPPEIQIAKTFDFHMHAFASPLPRPAAFRHADAYPNFKVWGWEVVSDRRQPGFTVLESVSAKGFRSSVRQWAPEGEPIPQVKLSIASPSLYTPGSPHSVTYVRLRDGNVRRALQKADAQGRLNFDLTGEPYQVGVAAGSAVAMSGYEISGADWATAGSPVHLQVKFWNVGNVRAISEAVQWESPNAGVKFDSTGGRLNSLSPGESTVLPLSFTVMDPARAWVTIYAVQGATRTPLDIPLFPPVASTKDFQIVDGRTLTLYTHAVNLDKQTIGQGNGDGHAAPGETFAILLPDGEGYRAAELFTRDTCVDNGVRASDSWGDYDHADAASRYSLPTIRRECVPGHIVRMLARLLIPGKPDNQIRYVSIEFPVWWRPGEEPK